VDSGQRVEQGIRALLPVLSTANCLLSTVLRRVEARRTRAGPDGPAHGLKRLHPKGMRRVAARTRWVARTPNCCGPSDLLSPPRPAQRPACGPASANPRSGSRNRLSHAAGGVASRTPRCGSAHLQTTKQGPPATPWPTRVRLGPPRPSHGVGPMRAPSAHKYTPGRRPVKPETQRKSRDTPQKKPKLPRIRYFCLLNSSLLSCYPGPMFRGLPRRPASPSAR